MRNRIAHGYLLVDSDIVRQTIDVDLPDIIQVIGREIFDTWSERSLLPATLGCHTRITSPSTVMGILCASGESAQSQRHRPDVGEALTEVVLEAVAIVVCAQ